jgi:hypothetical protein
MWQETAGLRDFSPLYVRFGSFATEAGKAHARPLRSESGQLAEHLAMSA